MCVLLKHSKNSLYKTQLFSVTKKSVEVFIRWSNSCGVRTKYAHHLDN